MRALLDVNVLIALFDPDHSLHDRAHTWWARNSSHGWASCPITEIGIVRIMSHPAYSKKTRFAPGELIERLDLFASATNHEFWPDAISFREGEIFTRERMHSSKQLTDLYLLGLAVQRRGRLATFDESVPLTPVRSAKPVNLALI
jgi:toxin-antitoxin system PIN domain toxin